ncbi:MAG: hypothetical protein IJK31_08395 [Ruminococcus sp.]|nr:hypothetical protein [Ruminococcus sp.]
MEYSIREIIENLYNIKNPNALSAEEMNFLEDKFGELPFSLKAFYSLCGSDNNIIDSQDTWITPNDYRKWSWLSNNKYMVLLKENQGCYIAAILENDLGKANPVVYSSDDFGESWKVCADSTDSFIKAVLYYEAVFKFHYKAESLYCITDDEFEIIKSRLELLPFHLDNWFGKIWLFQDLPTSAAFVIENDGDYQMSFGAASKEAFVRISEKLGGIGEEM